MHKLEHIEEPSLTFNYSQKVTDPRDGLTLFGPFSKNKVNNFSVGIIGTRQGIARMRKWLGDFVKPIYPNVRDVAKPFYPGFEEIFGVTINFNSLVELVVNEPDLKRLYRYSDPHIRVASMVDLYVDQLEQFKAEDVGVPPAVWFVVIPDEVYAVGRVQSRWSGDAIKVGIKDKFQRHSRGLFDEIDEETRRWKECYKYENNFHNQLKLKLLKHGLVTQIMRESTLDFRGLEFVKKNGAPKRDLTSMITDVAWNVANSVYYKIGGLPWKLGSIRPDVCYIGLVFKKDERQIQPDYACCAAQMFLDSGDGMVFKGAVGPWYNHETREYHLTQEAATDLLTKALASFKASNEGKLPKEIFIHGRSHFKDDEWQGFMDAVAELDVVLVGVVIKSEKIFKLYRQYDFPILRGSYFELNYNTAYVWSKGFVPRTQQPFGTEVPNPLSVKIVRGKGHVSVRIVCQDILALTKLNYNSCKFCDGSPVTLKFANLIGDVLTTGPTDDIKIALPFRNYI